MADIHGIWMYGGSILRIWKKDSNSSYFNLGACEENPPNDGPDIDLKNFIEKNGYKLYAKDLTEYRLKKKLNSEEFYE